MSRRSRATAGRPDKFMMKDIMRASYRDLFREAKEDLLATALWKSRLLTDPAASPQRPIAQKTADETWMKKIDEQRALTQDPKLAAGKGARREDEMLEKLPEMARSLAGIKK
jgi:hypothetical protein